MIDKLTRKSPNQDYEPSPEELAEWAELEAAMLRCPKVAEHLDVGDDGCLECGFGSK